MAQYTRNEILANRKKWIDFLMQPERKKATGMLDRGNDERCCLGHGCYILGIERWKEPNVNWYVYEGNEELPPSSFVEMVGLKDPDGDLFGGYSIPFKDNTYCTLVDLNDDSTATPQEIGAYLLSVIEGGDDTPFKPLSSYK